MKAGTIQLSGDFDKLDPVVRHGVEEELRLFLEREQNRFVDYHLHLHLKLHSTAFGNSPLVSCMIGLHTNTGRYNVSEEGFGVDAALGNALLSLKYRVDKHFDIRQDARQKADGRKGVPAET